ncbi:hypothetical protein V8F33_011107 [Rhypophila sp. PSN 637]
MEAKVGDTSLVVSTSPLGEQIWNQHYRQDPVLGALRGSDEDLDKYLSSVTTYTLWSHSDDTSGCVDPRQLQWAAIPTDAALLPSPLLGVPSSSPPQPASTPPAPSDTSMTPSDGLSMEISSSSPDAADLWVRALISGRSMSMSTSPSQTAESDGTWSTPCTTAHVDLPVTPLTDAESQTAATLRLNSDSENTQQARRKSFPCQVPACSVAVFFSSKKDLDRHCNSVHGSAGDKGFRCRCGRLDTRKDNHDRHIRGCRKEVKTSYRCWCRHETSLVTEHQEHIRRWTKKSGCP